MTDSSLTTLSTINRTLNAIPKYGESKKLQELKQTIRVGLSKLKDKKLSMEFMSQNERQMIVNREKLRIESMSRNSINKSLTEQHKDCIQIQINNTVPPSISTSEL